MTRRHLAPAPTGRPLAGRWAIAGTPTTDPYPCTCKGYQRCNPKYCACAGRPDPENGGPRETCCGWLFPAGSPQLAAALVEAPRRRGRP